MHRYRVQVPMGAQVHGHTCAQRCRAHGYTGAHRYRGARGPVFTSASPPLQGQGSLRAVLGAPSGQAHMSTK